MKTANFGMVDSSHLVVDSTLDRVIMSK
jgi:hypothetical protein